MNYQEVFPSQDEDTMDLLVEMTTLRETYDTHTLRDRIRYTTLVAQFTDALRKTNGSYRAHVSAPFFSRRGVKCDCMWSELLFSAVDLGHMFLQQQTALEKDKGTENVTTEDRLATHTEARSVIGILHHAITEIKKGWKGLKPRFFADMGLMEYDWAQLVAIHRWVQAYGLWNRGFIAKHKNDVEPAAIFRTCVKILSSQEAQAYCGMQSICRHPLADGTTYEKLTEAPKPAKKKKRHEWHTWAQTEWLMVAASSSEMLKNLPRLLAVVRLLYVNQRPGAEIPAQLWELESRVLSTSSQIIPDGPSLLHWLTDRYPLLAEECSMAVGVSPLLGSPFLFK